MTAEAQTVEGWQLEKNSAEAYELYLATAFRPWADQLVQRASVQQGNRVLDVACGTGIVARAAAASAGESGSVVGIDLNADMLAVAQRVSASVRPAIEWRQGTAVELPFPDRSFDVALCEQAIQFFSEPVTALAEMRRVLTRGGRAAVSVCRPIAYSPSYVAMAGALERHVGPEAGAMMRSPFSPWDLKQFRHLFTEAGFATVHVTIEICNLRYPSFEEFLRREAASSPLAGPVSAANAEARGGVIRDLERALADHVDDAGVVCPIETYVAVAQ